jgi:hypothetical protein
LATFGLFRTTKQGWRLRCFWTIVVIALVLWRLGLITSYTLGGVMHLLLIVASAVLLINLITGRGLAI